MSDNPLLQMDALPAFRQIRPEHVEPALDTVLTGNRQAMDALLDRFVGEQVVLPDDVRADILKPLEDIDDQLSRMWSPVGHLNAVVNSEPLRAAYNACLPRLSAYATELGQNERLFRLYRAIRDSRQWESLDVAERKAIDNALRDFHLSGVDLPAAWKARYKEIRARLSELSSQFSERVLDSTQAFHVHIEDESRLSGLPESQIAAARAVAQSKGKTGVWLTLDMPVYLAVMTYADDPELRETFYRAYTTRASDEGPFAGQWDNNPLIEEILRLRTELAHLLGYADYAHYSLATKMAKDPAEVVAFLNDLARRARPAALQDVESLKAFARQQFGVDTLSAWDYPYYSEKLKESRYAISQEALRPYFPFPRVIDGLFAIAHRLFGISIVRNDAVECWHDDACYYDVLENGRLIAGFYLDAYSRAHKRGGAWMDDCRIRRRCQSGELVIPVAYLTCNFNRPMGDTPALLTHDEVTTLFHEFGHGLHHMLTRIETAAVSGINGVAWDAVELPSQFMENWCWEPEALALMSGHYLTGEPLPRVMLEKMLAAKHFQSAMVMMRQLEFALFDMRIHSDTRDTQSAREVLQAVRDAVAVVKPPAYNRFECSFSHIFAGGYAAGYYSYKWAEVLSADAFSRFESEGVFNAVAGHDFRRHVLEQGGAEEAMDLFVRFRGRRPTVDALLRHSGLAA